MRWRPTTAASTTAAAARGPEGRRQYPDREPDLASEEVCGYQWPLIYRLMGDWHQQHIDWAYTEQTGLARPINHGVCTAGIAMRHLIALLIPRPGAPRRFRVPLHFSQCCRARAFTQVWKMGEARGPLRVVDADDGSSPAF